jgi:hypothetical protein
VTKDRPYNENWPVAKWRVGDKIVVSNSGASPIHCVVTGFDYEDRLLGYDVNQPHLLPKHDFDKEGVRIGHMSIHISRILHTHPRIEQDREVCTVTDFEGAILARFDEEGNLEQNRTNAETWLKRCSEWG